MRSRFLLAEDDRSMARLVEKILNEFGDVTVVYDGRHALKLVERSSDWALLWLDHLMPGARGADVARRARDLECPATRFIVTSYPSPDNAFAAFVADARFVPKDYIIEKPFTGESVRHAVIDHVWFLLDAAHPSVRATCGALGLTAGLAALAVAAANRIEPKALASALDLSESGLKSRTHRLLGVLHMPGRSLEEAGMLFRKRCLAHMRLPPEARGYRNLIGSSLGG